MLPPPHVLQYWRKQGKSQEWINERCQKFAANFDIAGRRRLPDANVLFRLYQGRSLRDVAEMFGVSFATIHRRLAQAGYPRHPMGRRKKG